MVDEVFGEQRSYFPKPVRFFREGRPLPYNLHPTVCPQKPIAFSGRRRRRPLQICASIVRPQKPFVTPHPSSVMTASGHKSASQTRLPPSPSGEGRVRCVHTASWDCRGYTLPLLCFMQITALSVGRGVARNPQNSRQTLRFLRSFRGTPRAPAEKRNDLCKCHLCKTRKRPILAFPSGGRGTTAGGG